MDVLRKKIEGNQSGFLRELISALLSILGKEDQGGPSRRNGLRSRAEAEIQGMCGSSMQFLLKYRELERKSWRYSWTGRGDTSRWVDSDVPLLASPRGHFH